MSKLGRNIVAALVLIALLAVGFFAVSQSSNAPSWMRFGQEEAAFKGGYYDPPREVHELINAVDQNGDPFTFAQFRGKTIFAYFGYTNCPDACPATLAEWREVKAILGDKVDDVVFVMISVDPERDTPERLKQWLGFWDPSFYGVTMSPEDTKTVTDQWGIRAEKRDAGSQSGYLVDHDVSTYVIGPDGMLHLTFPLGFPPEDIVSDIEKLQRASE